jgi:hypothetical protein
MDLGEEELSGKNGGEKQKSRPCRMLGTRYVQRCCGKGGEYGNEFYESSIASSRCVTADRADVDHSVPELHERPASRQRVNVRDILI